MAPVSRSKSFSRAEFTAALEKSSPIAITITHPAAIDGVDIKSKSSVME
jgi:hypothetical protein